MKLKDWVTVIGASAVTLAVTLLVAYGALELFVDTGRRILH
jgi:hypothetical protein